jgi:hypothetical protein
MRNAMSLGVLAFLLAACGNYHEVYNSDGGKSVDKSAFKTLSYAAVQALVFDGYCAHCHGNTVAKANLNVDNYQSVLGMRDKIKSDVMSDHMPMNETRVPSDLKTILVAWVDAGAPMTSNLPMPGGLDHSAPPPPAAGL